MNIHEKNRIIYAEAKKYLEQNANPQKYMHYFNEYKVQSLEEAYEVAVTSVRDITVTGGVIKYDENYDIIKECLFDFNYKKVFEKYGNGKDDRYEKLKESFVEKIQPKGIVTWGRFSKYVCGVAELLYKYDSVENMFQIFNKPQNADERIELINDIVSNGITLFKFKMVSNWLKDIGANGFAKPDSVLSYICNELNLADDSQESVFKAINLMAEDNNESVFMVDRVFWLIGTSASVVIKEIERKKGKNKEDFVRKISSMIN